MAPKRMSAVCVASRVPAALAACGLILSACATPTAGGDGLYARPVGDAPVTANPTPYSNALVCLGQYARSRGLRAPRERAYWPRHTRALE